MSYSDIYVLLEVKNKTGEVITTMTAMGSALMKAYALQNTKSGRSMFIINRSTGKVEYATQGRRGNAFPIVRDARKEDLGTCDDLGISLEDLIEIGYDDRFDTKEV